MVQLEGHNEKGTVDRSPLLCRTSSLESENAMGGHRWEDDK